MIALSNVIGLGMKHYRYRSSTTYYDSGDVLGDNNYWQLVNTIGGNFWLAAFSVAFITQLLAIFGIANGINVMVWAVGLGGIGSLVNMVTGIMAWYGYDLAYQLTEDSSTSASDLVDAAVVMAAIKDDMMMATIDGLSTELGLASVSEEWFMWNMWKAEGEEKMEEGMEGPPRENGEEGPRGPPTRELIAQVIDIINF